MLDALDTAFNRVKGLESIVEKMTTDLELSRNQESQLIKQLRKMEEKYNDLNKSNAQLYRDYQSKCEDSAQSLKELKEVNDKYDKVLTDFTNFELASAGDDKLIRELNSELDKYTFKWLETCKLLDEKELYFNSEIEELTKNLDWLRYEKAKALDNWREAELSLSMTIDDLNHQIYEWKEKETLLNATVDSLKSQLNEAVKITVNKIDPDVDYGFLFLASIAGFILGLLL